MQALGEIMRPLCNQGLLRQALAARYLHYAPARIRFLMSERYDYWSEFQREYAFLRSQDGLRHDADLVSSRAGESERVSGRFHLVGSREQLRDIIEGDGDDLAVLLTTEGIYFCTIDAQGRPLPVETALQRVQQLKAMSPPPFFVSPAHHFDNGFCGHARSIPDKGQLIIDQSARIDVGLEERDELGLRVLRALLDLDRDLNDLGGRRILVDAKHMSARSRQQYYARIVRPYNQARRGSQPRLPVIFSHVGYSGVATLDRMVADLAREGDHWRSGGWYANSVNVSDEDVRMVHASQGLIGLIFDRRLLGVGPGQQVPQEQWPLLLCQQLLGMADVIVQDKRLPADERRTIWDRLCLGTDFDGVINPVPIYPTALALERFAEDLARLLHEQRHTRMIAEIGVDALVEKLAWENAYRFALRHLPSAP